jgi:hypothetical protein
MAEDSDDQSTLRDHSCAEERPDQRRELRGLLVAVDR